MLFLLLSHIGCFFNIYFLFQRNKHNPSLHLWARSWVNSDEDQPMGGAPDCIMFQQRVNQNLNPETYITSEHSYQKPSGMGHQHKHEQGFQTVSQTPSFIPKEEEVSLMVACEIKIKKGELGKCILV